MTDGKALKVHSFFLSFFPLYTTYKRLKVRILNWPIPELTIITLIYDQLLIYYAHQIEIDQNFAQ